MFDSDTWNHLIMRKQVMSDSFKNKVTYKLFTWNYEYICEKNLLLWYMYLKSLWLALAYTRAIK